MRFALLLSAAILTSSASAAEPAPGFKLPPGFEITQYAGPELANDIYTLRIDADGRIVVAGRGYVRQLIDTDNDGKADKAVELIPAPKGGPMGLLWEKEMLYVVVDGGLQCYRGVSGKRPSTEKPTTVLAIKADGEHAAHAVRRGADGALYLLCGNNSGITAKNATYFADRKPVALAGRAEDPELAKHLWSESEKLVGLANGTDALWR